MGSVVFQMKSCTVEQKQWVQQRLELLPGQEVLNQEEERRVLRKMSDAENFERLLHQRFPGTKRFSLDGGETLVPLMDVLVEHAASAGVREMVIGMAHRGRLNVLANIFNKTYKEIFSGLTNAKYFILSVKTSAINISIKTDTRKYLIIIQFLQFFIFLN